MKKIKPTINFNDNTHKYVPVDTPERRPYFLDQQDLNHQSLTLAWRTNDTNTSNYQSPLLHCIIIEMADSSLSFSASVPAKWAS